MEPHLRLHTGRQAPTCVQEADMPPTPNALHKGAATEE